ncbi:MAG TPA: DUF6616 family protein [Longimicrobiales bacterium]|nr:DUF6616 family protein [Longimicrobiales bacterium]
MYIYVEQWTPKQAWQDASPEKRQAFIESIMPIIRKHEEEMGIETIAMASIDPEIPHGTGHAYVSVLRMPDEATARQFERDIASVDWYTYFDQANTRGKIRSAEEVIGEHITM